MCSKRVNSVRITNTELSQFVIKVLSLALIAVNHTAVKSWSYCWPNVIFVLLLLQKNICSFFKSTQFPS